MIPANVLMAQSITSHGDNGRKGYGEGFACGRDTRKKPGNVFSVCEGEDKLVDYAVDAYGAGDEGERGIRRVAENEVVGVEVC
jgi:hypothetical protein